MDSCIKSMTPQERYNYKISQRYQEKTQKERDKKSKKQFKKQFKKDIQNSGIAEYIENDIRLTEETMSSGVDLVEPSDNSEILADEPVKLKKFLVSFDRVRKPLIKINNQPKIKRDFVVIEAPRAKEARERIREVWDYKTLANGGISNIKVTELTPDQVAEYEMLTSEQRRYSEHL